MTEDQLDWDMLAHDVAAVFASKHGLNVSQDNVRPFLEKFVTKVQRHAGESDV